MRADRLVSIVLLLRQRGQMTAPALAAELEVSTRTILRDVEALSTAGVPVYTDRGRHGGISLLPGFRTQLSGLTHDEALALTTTARSESLLGLGPQLASALRKVVDTLPEADRERVDDSSRRLLHEPTSDLLGRPPPLDDVAADVLTELRQAVVAGRKIRLHYSRDGDAPQWRTVDPIGLVTTRGRSYLLATRDGQDRTYRLSRVMSAQALPAAAERPGGVDLARLWAERARAFLSEGHIAVRVRVEPGHREALLDLAESVRSERPVDGHAGSLFEVTFQDLRHAEWALWQLGGHAEALHPPELRAALGSTAARVLASYATSVPNTLSPPARPPSEEPGPR